MTAPYVGSQMYARRRSGIPNMSGGGGPIPDDPRGISPAPPLGGPQIPGGGTTGAPGGPLVGQGSRGGIPGMPWQTYPMVNQQQTDASWMQGKAQWDAQNAAGMSPAQRAKAAGDPNWQKYETGGQAQPNGTFSASNNLINAQFSADPSRRTQQSQRATDRAMQGMTNYQFQPFQAQGPINDTASRNAFTQANQATQSMQAAPYSPVAGTDLSGARNYLATAGANLGPSSAASGLVGPGAMGSFGYQGDTMGVRGQTQAQLNNVLHTTPDRATLASNAFNRLIQESNPQFQQDLRAVGQKAAALGRVGAGMTTNDLGTVAQRRNEQLANRAAELSDNAASLALQDQQDKLNAARGVTSDFASQDTGAGSLNLGYMNAANAERGAAFDRSRALGNDTFGRALDLSNAETRMGQIGRQDALDERNAQRQSFLDRNDVLGQQAQGLRSMGSDLNGLDSAAWNRATSERDAGLQYDQNMFNNRRNLFNDLSANEQRNIGNDLTRAQFNRGERDYQYGLSQDATNQAINNRLMQENLLNSRFGRGQSMFNAGYSTNPINTLGSQYQSYANDAQASYGGMGDLLGNYMLRNRGQNKAFDVPGLSVPEFNIPDVRAY